MPSEKVASSSRKERRPREGADDGVDFVARGQSPADCVFDLAEPRKNESREVGPALAEVLDGSRWTGAILDPERNNKGEGLISADHSPVAVWVVPTDEEGLIARHTAKMLQ